MFEEKRKNVDTWIEYEKEDKHKSKALENASRHFDENDNLTIHTLEAVYGYESSFGTKLGKNPRGSNGPAGHFQIEKRTAEDYGLIVTKDNDQRFDIDYASDAAARYLKTLYGYFTKGTRLRPTERVISPVPDINERKKFTVAAYNAGQGRIAQTQMESQKAGETVSIWDNVKAFLREGGATENKEEEITKYVPVVELYEEEFAKKSLLDKKAKDKEPKKVADDGGEGCHWVTLDHGPVCID